jgi:alpha-N-arabinofuranosidase
MKLTAIELPAMPLRENTVLLACLLAFITAGMAPAAEWHVAVTGDDANAGTPAAPFRSIQRAAVAAMPGDAVTVHAGVYRERVNPPRGGESDAARIIYQAAPGEHVEIKGSEVVKGWSKVAGDTWRVVLPAAMFGDFNPYQDLIRGDWFANKGRQHHTGAVYLNGAWLSEAATPGEVLDPAGSAPLWFATVEPANTTIHARFKGVDPNRELVEINVRRTVFYPEQPGRDYLTVRGFTMRHAATPWAPPTAEQIGLIGTHWSKGWIIENNVISHSMCSGIALGKHGDNFDNTSANSAEGYVKTIERAHAFRIPWTRDRIGHHLVRNNVVSNCEQAGIVGSLGGSFSTISGNLVQDIHVRRLFGGAEMAGIKLHGAIDCLISHNLIRRTNRGLWLDWMAQGARVSANVFADNLEQDVYMEVNHGPYLLDNNIFLSRMNLWDMSEGGAFVHNLFGGLIVSQPERSRATPFHPAHSTAVAGLVNIQGGDDRYFNNLFIGKGGDGADAVKAAPQHSPRGAGFGLWAYDPREAPVLTGGNVFHHGARPYRKETGAVVKSDFNPKLAFREADGKFILSFQPGPQSEMYQTISIDAAALGKTMISGQAFENADGTPLRVDTDFFGKPRDASPAPGPFENPAGAEKGFVVWDIDGITRPEHSR